jgi:hypothetical protein
VVREFNRGVNGSVHGEGNTGRGARTRKHRQVA